MKIRKEERIMEKNPTMKEVNPVIKTLASEINRLGIEVIFFGVDYPVIDVPPKYIKEITRLVAFFNRNTNNLIYWGIRPNHVLMIVPILHKKVRLDILMESAKEFGERLKELKTIPEF